MALNFVFKVNGVDCPTPSKFGWSRQRVSSPDSGRTLDAVMHVNQVAQKEKIELAWNAPDYDKASTILTLFDAEYIDVTYRSPLTNSIVTKKFYTGDRSGSTYWWLNNGLFETISFNIIEV